MPPPLVVVVHLFQFKVMRIASWNVNSVNARLDIIIDWLSSDHCDVLLIQETKTQDKDFPESSFASIGWNVAAHGQKSYNGVAIVSRFNIDHISSGLPGDYEDKQARYIEAQVNGIWLASIYLPNGNPAPGPKFDYKLQWMERLNTRAKDFLRSEKLVVLGGDFNVIPEDRDCYDPIGWAGDALTQSQTRKAFRKLLYSGYYDALRMAKPNDVIYTYWDYQGGAWQLDNGVRIDHLILSSEAANSLVDAGVDKTPRSLERPSDHTPVWCELKI